MKKESFVNKISIYIGVTLVLLIWLLTAYIVNYKDPWQHPVKPGRAMGL